MKIIFNSSINDWFRQIYDELKRHHEVILPENYRDKSNKNRMVDLNALEKIIKKNNDIDFIFDLRGFFHHLIEWTKLNINIPLVLFDTNTLNRPYKAKRSIFANIWYVEKFAKPLMESYNRNNLIYQGMAANPYIFFPYEIKKIYDIGFIGSHYGDRKYWINLLQKFCLENKIKHYFSQTSGTTVPWSFKDINQIYNQTKINISFAQNNKPGRRVNLRTFEICMSGNFQLMQYSPNVYQYFEIDEEIMCWKNKKELFDKILYYLENEDEREKIAKKGYKRAIKNHTWSKRIEEIGAFIKKKENLSIARYKNNINNILDKKDIRKLQKILFNENDNNKIIEFILKKKGYNLKRDMKYINTIKIVNFRQKITTYYKPDLRNFYFLKCFGKVMMVIKVIHSQSPIIYDDWNDFRKVFYLFENKDQSMAQYGILSNGNEWIIQDRKNRKWLREIPSKKALKARVNLIEILIQKIFQDFTIKYNFPKLVNILSLGIKDKLSDNTKKKLNDKLLLILFTISSIKK